MSNIYHDWLVDCVERRKWSWPRIALCLVHWIKQYNMTRRELLDGLKRDYQKASDEATESKIDPTPPDDKFKSYQEEVSKMTKKHFDSLYLGKFPTQKAADDEADTK